MDDGCVCTDGQTQACYTGPAGTAGVGACRGGTQACAGGHWGACLAEVLPAPEACNGVDDDCDGAVDDGLTPPPNSNQLGACQGSTRACQGAGGWVDDYGSLPGYGRTEVPDPLFADENCDGIDGDVTRAVFVASSGADGGACTQAAPCLTLAYAQAAAVAAGKDHVYVQVGSYPGPVELRSGLSIFGGYDLAWVRGPAATVTLHGGVGPGGRHLAVWASNASATLADLTVVAPDALGLGQSSYAIHASRLVPRRSGGSRWSSASEAPERPAPTGSPAGPAPPRRAARAARPTSSRSSATPRAAAPAGAAA